MFKSIIKALFSRISHTEVVDVESGEIFEQGISQSEQLATGIVYAQANSDVPLYKQDVNPNKSIRICITGAFDVKRADIVARLNDMGYSVGKFNNKTELLLIGTWGAEVGEDGVSNKYLGAASKGTKMVKLETADQIYAMLSAKTYVH